MDGKICDQVLSIFIYPGSNYSYVNPGLVNKCGLNKVHAKLVSVVGYRYKENSS